MNLPKVKLRSRLAPPEYQGGWVGAPEKTFCLPCEIRLEFFVVKLYCWICFPLDMEQFSKRVFFFWLGCFSVTVISLVVAGAVLVFLGSCFCTAVKVDESTERTAPIAFSETTQGKDRSECGLLVLFILGDIAACSTSCFRNVDLNHVENELCE